MKICPNCGASMADNAKFCIQCGMASANMQHQQYDSDQQYRYNDQEQYRYNDPNRKYNTYDPYDHTAEFSPEDIKENRLYALLIYVASLIGVVIALMIDKKQDSAYLRFHIRQGIKLFIMEGIVLVIMLILSWATVFVVIGVICLVFCFILNVIAFVQVCRKKAKEIPVIRLIGFLK